MERSFRSNVEEKRIVNLYLTERKTCENVKFFKDEIGLLDELCLF
jgi:hypothetical protein